LNSKKSNQIRIQVTWRLQKVIHVNLPKTDLILKYIIILKNKINYYILD